MGKTPADGVIEAIRYTPQKQIALARVYLRRGPTYSDRVLLTRDELITQMQTGKTFFTGTRKPYLASTFFINQQLALHHSNGIMLIGVKDSNSLQDEPDLAPLF
jgi:hypothetical protein